MWAKNPGERRLQGHRGYMPHLLRRNRGAKPSPPEPTPSAGVNPTPASRSRSSGSPASGPGVDHWCLDRSNEKVAPYAGLFGIGESQLFRRKFTIWFPTVLIPLLLLVVLVAYYGCESSRRHLKLSPATTIMGGASTLGWIITLPYLSAWLVFGSLALQGQERENQEYCRSQHEGWREIENRRIQELLERPRIPVR